MCPQLPRLSPEYSHKAGLQTVITGMSLQIRPVTHGGHAGPVTMGRITRGPLSWTRLRCGMPFVASLRLVRYMRRVSLLVLSLLAQLLQRRLRAKGGAFAFAPTDTGVGFFPFFNFFLFFFYFLLLDSFTIMSHILNGYTPKQNIKQKQIYFSMMHQSLFP
jgi:hypothetical protein